MGKLQNASEAEPEEEKVENRDQDGGDFVLAGAHHHGREETRRRAMETQPMLHADGEGGWVAV